MRQRKNKTISNLTTLWKHLDMILESKEHADYLLTDMVDVPEEIVRTFERLDVSGLTICKDEIEALIVAKGGKLDI